MKIEHEMVVGDDSGQLYQDMAAISPPRMNPTIQTSQGSGALLVLRRYLAMQSLMSTPQWALNLKLLLRLYIWTFWLVGCCGLPFSGVNDLVCLPSRAFHFVQLAFHDNRLSLDSLPLINRHDYICTGSDKDEDRKDGHYLIAGGLVLKRKFLSWLCVAGIIAAIPVEAWGLWRIVTTWDGSRRFASGLIVLLVAHGFVVLMLSVLIGFLDTG